jgi:2-oxoglutarate ferredoxin oxidoreductase subunit beta
MNTALHFLDLAHGHSWDHAAGAAREPQHTLEDYQSGVPRWCTGCGDNGILASVQRLCRDEQLPPERTVFVSGIGCSSRFPHYMHTYGFHSLHGRALPIAQGIKLRRPDLHVFVNTGDGDCCSIGTAHWIHAIRNNMDITMLLHDNEIYGLTKMQMSPTSPRGLHSKTSPHGSWLEPLNPLSVTLGVANVSFVAQCTDWMPDLLEQLIALAHAHRGFSFVRILQRCPNFLPDLFDAQIRTPSSSVVLEHSSGLRLTPEQLRAYRSRQQHDPSDLAAARALAADTQRIPVGVLYRNDAVPCYEDLRRPRTPHDIASIAAVLDRELDRFSAQ